MGRVITLLAGLAVGLSCVGQAAPPKINVSPIAPPEWRETYGDWSINRLPNGATLATVRNSAGNVFGTLCDDSGCTAIFNPQINCKNGGKYEALVNSPAAAFSVELECEKLNDVFLYSLPLAGGVTEAMAVGGVLGIAFPMESGQFKVARFSLTGAARATARASQVARGATSAPRQDASDNFSL